MKQMLVVSLDEVFEKAHVKAHTSKTKSGKLSQVKEYERKTKQLYAPLLRKLRKNDNRGVDDTDLNFRIDKLMAHHESLAKRYRGNISVAHARIAHHLGTNSGNTSYHDFNGEKIKKPHYKD